MHSGSPFTDDRKSPGIDESRTAPSAEPDWSSGDSPTEEQKNALYDNGRMLYQQRKFEEATVVFLYLMMEDLFDARYAFAFGACLQAITALEVACMVYSHCRMLEPENPLPAFHLGECQMQLGQREEALQSYRDAVDLSKENPDLCELTEQARGMADLIEGTTRD